MRIEPPRFLKARLLLFSRMMWRKKGLWLRATLCLIIGIIFIIADRDHEYDLRQVIRGEQSADHNIVLIHTPSADIELTDWEKIIRIILNENPKVVGVSTFFSAALNVDTLKIDELQTFVDRRIIWSMRLNEQGRVLNAKFAKIYSANSGLNELAIDRDGVVRRFRTTATVPHFALQIAKASTHYKKDFTIPSTTESKSGPIINFRGPRNTFLQLSTRELIEKKFPPMFLKNKIVLIGSEDTYNEEYLTPVGKMTKIEILANIVDNLRNSRWIDRPHLLLSSLIILLFVILTAIITSTYPQFLAVFSICFINLIYTALSLWFFDTYYFWLPLFSVYLASFVTYITFISFQLTLKDYLNTQLENEKEFLFQVEELKNNFLSLISHDLKTPIAKIQAICDRLIATHDDKELNQDLNALRDVATELHRYIKTILQITRVESRDFSLKKEASDINEIIEAVILQLDPLARNKNIKIEQSLEPIFLIEMDPILIHEVILNLVENAIKYTPEYGQVTVSSAEVDDRVIIMVRDTGPGIPAQEQAKIFDKFYQGELGKSQPKGSGLGLYLVKYFVELHDGKIFLESSPKHGTKVGFSLPLNESENAATIEESNKEVNYESAT